MSARAVAFAESYATTQSSPVAKVAAAALPPVFLGLDGRPAGLGAAAVALSLAREWGSTLRVVSMLERERELPLVGSAVSGGSSLIVIGLRDPSERAPVLVDEAVMRVMRRACVPVLAVASGTTQRPRTAVAAVDFGASSVNAARMALRVLQPGGTLFLAHVQPDFTSARADSEEIALSYLRGIAGAFDNLLREITPESKARIEAVVLDGSPMGELTSFADQVGATLIAVGTGRKEITASHGLARLATALLRERKHSVLSAPLPHCDGCSES